MPEIVISEDILNRIQVEDFRISQNLIDLILKEIK